VSFERLEERLALGNRPAPLSCFSEHDRWLQVGEVWRAGTRRLAAAGIEDARLDAEVLLRAVLELPRASFFARLQEMLAPEHLNAYSALLDRRTQREPVAYILQKREFFGLDFRVDSRVLVPRPESETLVEVALEVAHAWRENGPTRPVLVDVGTGSGAIAITLAKHLPGARIYATDRSSEALAVAAANLRLHDASDRVFLLQGDLLTPVPEPADLIIANLPYVPSRRIDSLQAEVSRWEPREALDGGSDGLTLIYRLLEQARGKLRCPGVILLEADPEQMAAIAEFGRQTLPGARIDLHRDLAGRERVARLRWEV
jgi:release factor glutamine methyltransferase